MRIVNFEIQDADGWTLDPLRLDAFNLLVGVSGAGKTRIVRAIERVCAVALGSRDTEKDAEAARGARFAMDFEHDGLNYRWEAELEPPAWGDGQENGSKPEKATPLIRTERIQQGGQPLIERVPERFLFRGQEIPRLDRSKSAIAILKEDPAIAPLHVAFSRCIFRALNLMPSHGIALRDHLSDDRKHYPTIADLGADFSLPIHHKAELIQELFPSAFSEIAEAFCDAFPAVHDLRVHRFYPPRIDPTESELYNIAIAAEESGVSSWVFFSDMSSGMQRYLSFLVHLSFAPRGTVVLIDELESSLGINCLPAATRFLLRRATDLQLVLTSHHPYIIEQIPSRHWKIVTRKGSRVRVLDAAGIPALDETKSRLDRFTRLINLPEYEQGIQA